MISAIKGFVRLARSLKNRAQGIALDIRLGAFSEGVVRNDGRIYSRYSDHHYYEPVRGKHFYEALAHVNLDFGSSTFIDLGSGRGRPLLLAADMGFGRIIGVELDAALILRAQRNIDRWKSRHNAEVNPREFVLLHQDAACVDFPNEPLLVFLANPFGAETLRNVLDKLISSYSSSPRQIWLCYVNPVHEGALIERPIFEERSRANMWVVYSIGLPAQGV